MNDGTKRLHAVRVEEDEVIKKFETLSKGDMPGMNTVIPSKELAAVMRYLRDLQADIKAKDEALQKYGRHHYECRSLHPVDVHNQAKNEGKMNCTCGFH